MNSSDVKLQSIARLLNGQVVDDSARVAVCVKGQIESFPATFEAIYTHWPFGVVYTIETGPDSANGAGDSEQISIYPRFGRGVFGFFTRILLFEGSGMSVSDKRLEKNFNFSYSDRQTVDRFIHHPGVSELLHNLNAIARFNELVVRPGVGVYLSQPASFNAIDQEVFRQTFTSIAALGKALKEAF